VPLLFLLTVPAAFIVLGGLLWLTVLVEQRVLNPRSMILTTVRARGVSPEYAEAFVASEFERLLEQTQLDRPRASSR
jgi:hypothetical protein